MTDAPKRPADPEVEFWKEIRSLILSLVALIERVKLKGVVRIPTAEVRQMMRREGWEDSTDEES